MAPINLTHHFLIAMPSLADPNFSQTVTYVCSHTAEGAMGIVINRPLNFGLGEVLAQMQMEPSEERIGNLPVYQGGPVQRDRGFVLFRPSGQWGSSIQITEDVGVATSRDILEAISRGEGPADSLVALGYAGWAGGQLEQEMLDNAWLSSPADEDVIFNTPPQQRWHRAAALLGINIDTITHDAGHA
jgi:putative transcriptional regulator